MHETSQNQTQPRSHLCSSPTDRSHRQSRAEGNHRALRQDLSRVRIKALRLSVLSASPFAVPRWNDSVELGTDLMLEVVLFCVKCWKYCIGCGDDGCFYFRCMVTEWSGWGGEKWWILFAECRNDVVLVVGSGRSGIHDLSLGLSCLSGKVVMFFISLPYLVTLAQL